MNMKHTLFALIAVFAVLGPARAGRDVLGAQQVTKETREGIKNFSRLETTVRARARSLDASQRSKLVCVVN